MPWQKHFLLIVPGLEFPAILEKDLHAAIVT
jgi:hypothetical protein